MTYVIIKQSHDNREDDYRQLEQQLARTRDPRERANIMRAMETLRKERLNPNIRAMREALIRAKRRGDMDEIKNIHDDVRKDAKYRNDKW